MNVISTKGYVTLRKKMAITLQVIISVRQRVMFGSETKQIVQIESVQQCLYKPLSELG